MATVYLTEVGIAIAVFITMKTKFVSSVAVFITMEIYFAKLQCM
jgi:uncharacterized membrane protein YphA (DoxX/SURF4 family)